MIKKIPISTGLFLIASILFLSLPDIGQTKIWQVGPNFSLKKPSAAISLAKKGDTIRIMAGAYENDYSIINQDDLTIEGVNGFAHLISHNGIPNGKAIWVTNGRNITIRNIEFSGAHVPDKNGAGIRLQKGTLYLENCYFHGNETGILTSGNPEIRLYIINSEFSKNTQNYPDTGYLSHNIYVGAISVFHMENSISRGAKYGHAIKTRAQNNVIKGNRIFDEGDISASYLIDLPNGGKALIENNYLYKNKGRQNNAVISYGAEGMKYTDNSLTIKHNIAINESGVAFLLRNHSGIDAKFSGNKLTNISVTEISGIERDGFWDRMGNKIQNYMK